MLVLYLEMPLTPPPEINKFQKHSSTKFDAKNHRGLIETLLFSFLGLYLISTKKVIKKTFCLHLILTEKATQFLAF